LLPKFIASVEVVLMVSKIDFGFVEEGELAHGEGVAVEASMWPGAVWEWEAAVVSNLVMESMAGEEAERACVVEGSCEGEGRGLCIFHHEGAEADAV
jgi:hypothetical protein